MGVIKLISIAILVVSITPSQSADLSRQCIFVETARANDIIFRFKTTETASVFSLFINEIPHKDKFAVVDSGAGDIRLAKSLVILTWRTDKTLRITAILTQTKNGVVINRISIEFIILKEGWADILLPAIIGSVPTLAKSTNPFRQTTAGFPFYKKLHSILMRGTKRSATASLAECKFRSAFDLLVKLILKKLGANLLIAKIHVGPQGILTPAKLQELIEATGCIPELESPNCGPETLKYRTIDGTCNNLRPGITNVGAAETAFTRFLPPLYGDQESLFEAIGGGIDQLRFQNLPNPSAVTEGYIIIEALNQLNPDKITHLLMQWGQFLDHDMTLAPEAENGEVCESIPCDGSAADFVPPCFPILPAAGRPCIRLIRSAARCPINGAKLLPTEQINVNTAYIDGSMIYGSSEAVANAVRDLTNDFGLLRTSGVNLLPIDNSQLGEPLSLCENRGSCFLAGDTRVNEQAALAAMHTLWVREHNQIATALRNLNRHWDGERIYQETRKILGGVVQRITYDEWLPILIGQDALPSYKRYNPSVDAGISNSFATAAFRMGHSLVRPKFEFLYSNFTRFSFSPIPLRDAFFSNIQTQQNGIDGWLVGMVGNDSQVMDNEMARGLTNELFQVDEINREGLNLAALNMQRGRDHGLPFYSDFLAECQSRFPGLYPIDVSNVKSFDQIRDLFPPLAFESLKSVYNNDPQNTDLFPAGIGEKAVRYVRRRGRRHCNQQLPSPILGPTFTCLFIDQFTRSRDGDRFFYLNRTGVFTARQRQVIRKRSLSDIICNNINIVSVPNQPFLRGRSSACPNSGKPIDVRPWFEPVRSCDVAPCRNGGTCRSRCLFIGRRRRRNIIRCICPPGFNGRFCENKL